MSSIFKPFEKRKLSPKSKALLSEWKEIHETCKTDHEISYKIIKYNRDDLPVIYEITFNIPSFVELDKEKAVDSDLIEKDKYNKDFLYYPKIGNLHRMKISIPPKFPQINAKPKGTIVTPIWHPNIVCHGDDDFIGRVCFNEGNLDASVTITDRIMQVAEYFRYKNYLAEEREPYPYDLDVAYWIREIAEPLGWVVPRVGINYKKLGMETPEQVILKKDIPREDEGMIIMEEEELLEEDIIFDFDMVEPDVDNILEEDDEIIEL